MKRTITIDIVRSAFAAVQAFPSGVYPLWNAIGAGTDAAAQSITVTPKRLKRKNEIIE